MVGERSHCNLRRRENFRCIYICIYIGYVTLPNFTCCKSKYSTSHDIWHFLSYFSWVEHGRRIGNILRTLALYIICFIQQISTCLTLFSFMFSTKYYLCNISLCFFFPISLVGTENISINVTWIVLPREHALFISHL